MKKILVVTTALLVFVSCKKENPENENLDKQGKIQLPAEIEAGENTGKYNTFYGPAVKMGKGFARSWVNITHDNKPIAIGIEMTKGALQHDEHRDDNHNHANAHDIPLHQKAKALTPFDHIGANWSAAGHPPPGIYTVPHFDLHFYMMTMEERLRIPSYPEATAAFDLNPPEGYLPGGYVKSPAGEAKMGAHWMDVTSHEFQGQPFTHTFVFGSYNGKVNFYEPMVTLATLQSGASIQKAIRQPRHFNPQNTYYPTGYSIWKSGERHYVALYGMMWR